MKAVCQNTFGNGNIRFVAVSASIPNAEDIAEWIGRDNTKVYKFPEELRPVPLKKIILGYNYNPKTMPMFKFDLSLNYKLKKLIIQYSEGKPTLVSVYDFLTTTYKIYIDFIAHYLLLQKVAYNYHLSI